MARLALVYLMYGITSITLLKSGMVYGSFAWGLLRVMAAGTTLRFICVHLRMSLALCVFASIIANSAFICSRVWDVFSLLKI